MPRTPEQQREYMRQFMARKRANKNVSTPENANKVLAPNVSTEPSNETIRKVSERSIVLSDGQVYHSPTPDSSLGPSKASPRQPNRCIRCGVPIPSTDNFCSDPHYKEHLAWMESQLVGTARFNGG